MALYSRWGKQLNRENPLPDYPRVQMRRESFMNLNGTWEYQITKRKDNPNSTDWKPITVPFPMGSILSGSDDTLQPNQAVWYRKQFAYKPTDKRTLLHFEAVDMECTVFMNGLEVGSHQGGYLPFTMDISAYVKYQNALMVRIIDDTDYGAYAYGKQKIDHGGMWYTPTSGIWGTVWLEDISEHAIEDIRITPDYDHACAHVSLVGDFSQALVTVTVGSQIIHSGITNDKEYTVPLDNFHPWSCDDPFLYDVYVQTEDDTIRSYFGMRKVSKGKDHNGITRFCLNDKPLFLTGLLDQGYSVDGLVTYPDVQAIQYELQKIKDLGYNMIRKHIKIESQRWYYECDRLGILVMQDMPSGGYDHYDFLTMALLPNLGIRKLNDTGETRFGRMNEQFKKNYYEELSDMLDTLHNHPCIFAWCAFNEGWGQFDAVEVTKFIRKKDPTRLIDSTSGWHDQGCGDFDSVHHYFLPYIYRKDTHNRISLLSEFGGYSFVEAGHSNPKKLYGYKKFTDKVQWNNAVQELYKNDILPNIPKGLSGCIYTQVSDIEDECNGIFTADREICKLDERKMKKINEQCIRRVK